MRAGQRLRLDPAKLNIEARSRTSRLAWRGQFSPELIDYLIDTACPDSRSFLDPFCGSGTVLYEAAVRGHTAWGSEVNPAAWHLASLVATTGLSPLRKQALNVSLKEFAASMAFGSNELFGTSHDPMVVVEKLRSAEYDAEMTRSIAAMILLGMGDKPVLDRAALSRGALAVLGVLAELLPKSAVAGAYLTDARELPLPDGVVEAVITSPPYINVFNYHQNYRPAVEMLGWRPLEAAQSEIGANRKHRANRFLTVVQYAMDMSQVLREMLRVMAADAPLVIVMGRTSNVLGASFENGTMMRLLMEATGCFGPIQSEERRFLNRFGATIFEDILIARRGSRLRQDILVEAKEIGVNALQLALPTVPEKNRATLLAAIEGASEVRPSPNLRLSVPGAFQQLQSEGNWDGSHAQRGARRQA